MGAISAGTAGKPMTVRVASWSARHRWPVVAAWFIFTFGLFATSMALGGTKTLSQMSGGVPRTESALADQIFAAGGYSAPHEDLYLVVRNPDIATTDPARTPAYRTATRPQRTIAIPVTKAERVLEDLFNAYLSNSRILPKNVRLRMDELAPARVVCDYIAGMTDRFAVEEHLKLFEPLTRP